MGPFDVVTGRDHLVSQSGSVTILCESLKMFSRNGRRTRIFVCLLVCICFLTILPVTTSNGPILISSYVDHGCWKLSATSLQANSPSYNTFLSTTENCKSQIQRPRVPRPRVPRPHVPASRDPTSPRPTSPRPRPTFSHSQSLLRNYCKAWWLLRNPILDLRPFAFFLFTSVLFCTSVSFFYLHFAFLCAFRFLFVCFFIIYYFLRFLFKFTYSFFFNCLRFLFYLPFFFVYVFFFLFAF